MFIQTTENEFCMAVLPGDYFGDDYESFSPIGMLAQQNYNVGYDLNGMRVYFQRFDCELLVSFKLCVKKNKLFEFLFLVLVPIILYSVFCS